MRDPEGNGFCVQGPDPRKPHPYVGNVTFSEDTGAAQRLGSRASIRVSRWSTRPSMDAP